MTDSTEEQFQFLPPPPLSIVEQLAQTANKSEVISLLEFKEEQKLDKNDPLWAFLLEFKTIENSVNKQEEILNLLINGFQEQLNQQIEANQQQIDISFRTYTKDLINQYKALTDNLKTVEEARVIAAILYQLYLTNRGSTWSVIRLDILPGIEESI